MAKPSDSPPNAISAPGADNTSTPVQTSAPPDPAPALPPWIADEHAGLGGDYVFDPATGRRTRVGGPVLPASAA